MDYLDLQNAPRVNLIVLALVTAPPLFQLDLVILLSAIWLSIKTQNDFSGNIYYLS